MKITKRINIINKIDENSVCLILSLKRSKIMLASYDVVVGESHL